MKPSNIFLSTILFLLSPAFLSAQEEPPYDTVTIRGMAPTKYSRVALFENGAATEPLKTEYVYEDEGEYSIDLEIPGDMQEKDGYYMTDMRFFADQNENEVWDSGEARSQCHFIIWVPATNQIFMQVYQGPKIEFEDSTLEYDYPSGE